MHLIALVFAAAAGWLGLRGQRRRQKKGEDQDGEQARGADHAKKHACEGRPLDGM